MFKCYTFTNRVSSKDEYRIFVKDAEHGILFGEIIANQPKSLPQEEDEED